MRHSSELSPPVPPASCQPDPSGRPTGPPARCVRPLTRPIHPTRPRNPSAHQSLAPPRPPTTTDTSERGGSRERMPSGDGAEVLGRTFSLIVFLVFDVPHYCKKFVEAWLPSLVCETTDSGQSPLSYCKRCLKLAAL